MDSDLGVVVGTGIGGQRNIAEALESNGFRTTGVKQLWPRDHYVHSNEEYVKNNSPGFIDGNPFAEGGNILLGDGFLLVSDLAYMREQILKQLPQKITRKQIPEIEQVLKLEGQKHFPRTRIYIAPTGYFHGGKGHSHIDMFSLLCPRKKLLILDTFYGKGAGTAREYDSIADKEGLRLLRYDGSQDGVWYPLNSLVLDVDKRDVVAVDDRAVSLIRLLDREGIRTISTKMPQHPFPAGKVRCQTNTYNIGTDTKTLMTGI